MYKVYLVSYDLNSPGQNYTSLRDELKKSTDWWHYLDSTWLIYTWESANQVWNRIHSEIDKNDRVLIIEVKNNMQGWLTQDAWDWIHKYVK